MSDADADVLAEARELTKQMLEESESAGDSDDASTDTEDETQ